MLRSKEERTKLVKRVKFIKKLTNLNIEKVIHLEFDIQDEFVRYLKCKEKIGFHNIYHPETDKLLTKVINIEKNYVLDDCVNFANDYFNKKFKLEELRPNLKKKLQNINFNKGIIVGIGANSRKKIITPERMKEYLIKIYEKYPEEEVILIGKGSLELEISKKLEGKNIKNLVNKLSLEESLNKINDAKLYIGNDSGLYNLAFGLNKKIICFFGGEKNSRFKHNKFKNIEILNYDKNTRPKNIISKSKYGTYELNNISVKKFEEVLIKLMK